MSSDTPSPERQSTPPGPPASPPEPETATLTAEEPAPPEDPSSPPPEKRWFNRAKLARWVALGGAVAVVLSARSLVLPLIPETREVEVRLDAPADLIGLDMRWAPAGGGEDLATTSLHFSAGAAPSSVQTTVKLPDGAYDVDIVVMRSSRVDSTRRRVRFEGTSRVTIPLR